MVGLTLKIATVAFAIAVGVHGLDHAIDGANSLFSTSSLLTLSESLTRMTIDSMLDLLMLSDDFSGDSVVAQRNEFRMTKMTVDCPFEELDRCDPLRLQPAASLHVCGRFC